LLLLGRLYYRDVVHSFFSYTINGRRPEGPSTPDKIGKCTLLPNYFFFLFFTSSFLMVLFFMVTEETDNRSLALALLCVWRFRGGAGCLSSSSSSIGSDVAFFISFLLSALLEGVFLRPAPGFARPSDFLTALPLLRAQTLLVLLSIPRLLGFSPACWQLLQRGFVLVPPATSVAAVWTRGHPLIHISHTQMEIPCCKSSKPS
jgi:hypothetical protein